MGEIEIRLVLKIRIRVPREKGTHLARFQTSSG